MKAKPAPKIPKTIVLMGVSGCGKSTVGKLLAEKTGWVYIESDDYHSDADVRKMASGMPLDDEDRQPWLEILNHKLKILREKDQPAILGCSALKQKYREIICEGLDYVKFVYLMGSFDLIHSRMKSRAHFMKADMLQSQFDTLEEPVDALVVDIRKTPDDIVTQIMHAYHLVSQ